MIASPRQHLVDYKNALISFGMNNISDLSTLVVTELEKFPKENASREMIVGTSTVIDLTGTLFDTRWKDTVGAQVAPVGSVNFATNLLVAKEVNELIKELSRVIDVMVTLSSIPTSESIEDYIHLDDRLRRAVEFIDHLITAYYDSLATFGIKTTIPTPYTDLGYFFEPSTVGTEGRVEDVYTLTEYWKTIDYRTCCYALTELTSVFNNGWNRDVTAAMSPTHKDYKRRKIVEALIPNFLEMFRNSCRTFKDLSYRIITTTKIQKET